MLLAGLGSVISDHYPNFFEVKPNKIVNEEFNYVPINLFRAR